jgi:hypothetical protein
MSKLTDRDSAHLLLKQLTGHDSEDTSAALRLASHTALNLATEAGTNALWELGRALPWLAVYLDWTDHGEGPTALVKTITSRRLVAHVPDAFVLDTLERASTRVNTSAIRRAPVGASPETDPRIDAIARLARIDAGLDALVEADDAELLDTLLADTTLLDAALAIAATDSLSELALRLRDLLPSRDSSGPSGALRILAALELDSVDALPPELGLLEDRSRRFELSLAANMQRHGLLETVRAALAFGLDGELARPFFFQFSAFAADPSLEGLTRALIAMRGRCFGHLCGALPLEALSPWVDYLRDGCADLAEARGITLREAIHFAHYCLHLVNICDLAAVPGVSLKEPLRRSLMDVEDELKEFALIGQREGLSDTQSRLERYDRARWASQGSRAYLVDRLARLSGGWRKGTRPGPIGAPPRLHDEFVAPAETALEALLGEDAGTRHLDGLAALLARAELHGASPFEELGAVAILDLLIIACAAARDLPNVDVSKAYVVDCAPLCSWYSASAARADRVGLLKALVGHYPSGLLLEGRIEPTQTGPGVVARAHLGRVVLRFEADPELEALLTLLNHTPATGTALRDALSQRLEEMLFAPSPAPRAVPARGSRETEARAGSLGR